MIKEPTLTLSLFLKESYPRINAIVLLRTDWSLEEVVDETLRNYVKNYKDGGLEQLFENNYKGGTPKLQHFEILSEELE